MGSVFAPLPLRSALAQYDLHTRVRQRSFVPMTFREVRHVVNLATVQAVGPGLRLLCLDADETVYADGGTITAESPMIGIITAFIRSGITVCLVTAAGYPNAPDKYETRLRGLLDAFQFAVDMGAPSDTFRKHFMVMGGEANYLHRLSMQDGRLRLAVVPGEQWKNGRGVRWSLSGIRFLLDTAESVLLERAEALGLVVQVIRKERAVGIVRAGEHRFPYEVLEEIALAVQHALAGHEVPHCAFNGGQDVWVDVGNKALGIRAVQAFVGGKATAASTVHVGDRFTRTGNDTHAREAASTLWVSNPRETHFFLRLLLKEAKRAISSGAWSGSADVPEGADAPQPLSAAMQHVAAQAGVGGWGADLEAGDGGAAPAAAALPSEGVKGMTAAQIAAVAGADTTELSTAGGAIRTKVYTPEQLPEEDAPPRLAPGGRQLPRAAAAGDSSSRRRSLLEADGGEVVGSTSATRSRAGTTGTTEEDASDAEWGMQAPAPQAEQQQCGEEGLPDDPDDSWLAR